MSLPLSTPLIPRQTTRAGAVYSPANILPTLFGGKARAVVLRALFGLTHRELYRSEIVRLSGMADQGVDEQLRVFETVGLVVSRVDGNRRYFRANEEHPFYTELRSIVLKSSGLRDVLAEALKNPKVEIAFVFGSVARAEERPDSDVDLMIFGDVGFREMASAMRPLSEKLGREVNSCFFTRAEVARRLNSDDPFFSRVLEAPKLFVVGDEPTMRGWLDETRGANPPS